MLDRHQNFTKKTHKVIYKQNKTSILSKMSIVSLKMVQVPAMIFSTTPPENGLGNNNQDFLIAT